MLNLFHHFNRRYNLCNPAVAAAGVSAGGGILTGFMNQSAQRSAQIRQHRFDVDMFNRQAQFSREERDNAREYNSPRAELERKLAAGLNPYSDSDQGMSPVASTPSQGNTVGAEIEPMPNVLGSAVNTYIQSRMLSMNQEKVNAEVRNIDADTNIKNARAQIERETVKDQILRIAEDSKRSSWERRNAMSLYSQLEVQSRYAEKLTKGQLSIQDAQVREAESRIALNNSNDQMQKVLLEYAPKMHESQLAHYKALNSQLYASANELNSRVLVNKAQAALTWLQRDAQDLSNQQQKAIFSYTLSEAMARAAYMENKAKNEGNEFMFRKAQHYLNSANTILKAAGVAAGAAISLLGAPQLGVPLAVGSLAMPSNPYQGFYSSSTDPLSGIQNYPARR